LLDSGCTYYLYPRKEWFSTYEPFKEGTILMCNNAACKTVEIDSICMIIAANFKKDFKNFGQFQVFDNYSQL